MSNEARRQVLIVNKLGLHLRAAAQFVKVANQFDSDVVVRVGGMAVNGKSIMGLASLAAAKGSEMDLLVRGRDFEAAMSALFSLVEAGFHEE